jgi:hypothetical protein
VPATGDLAALPVAHTDWSKLSPALKATISGEANKVRAGKFRYLNANWFDTSVPPDPSFWQRFPDGTLWQGHDAYCFNFLARPRDNGAEIKYIWEINRLQFFISLAVDARLRDDVIAGTDLIVKLISSWMKGNKPYRGANWLSNIELALRTVSVAMALSILGVDRLDHSHKVMLERFFKVHGIWIGRYPSLYSSANNHRVAELVGLLVTTVLLGGMKNGERIRQRALRDLFNEIGRQIFPDGVGAEQSLAYTAFMVELSLIAFHCLELRPSDLPESVRQRLTSWANHVQWMMDKAGQVPAIGDCDESRVVSLTPEREPRYVASIAAAIAGYFQRPDLAPCNADEHLRDFLFASILESATVKNGVRTWKHGGYSVVRTGSVSRQAVFVFDHGPLGYPSIAAHGHADSLAIWLSVGDVPVIIDAGTYVYNSDALWRDRFRTSELHNTLSISGHSSSISAGLFNWSHKAKSNLLNVIQEPTNGIVAEHDGYLHRFSVYHRRSIRVMNSCSILVIDELVGPLIDEAIAISFLINPQYEAMISTESPNAVMIRDGNKCILCLSGNGALLPQICRGDESSRSGWVSPSFGLRFPAGQVTFRGVLLRPSEIRIDIL